MGKPRRCPQERPAFHRALARPAPPLAHPTVTLNVDMTQTFRHHGDRVVGTRTRDADLYETERHLQPTSDDREAATGNVRVGVTQWERTLGYVPEVNQRRIGDDLPGSIDPARNRNDQYGNNNTSTLEEGETENAEYVTSLPPGDYSWKDSGTGLLHFHAKEGSSARTLHSGNYVYSEDKLGLHIYKKRSARDANRPPVGAGQKYRDSVGHGISHTAALGSMSDFYADYWSRNRAGGRGLADG
jgi:hypothetical protein